MTSAITRSGGWRLMCSQGSEAVGRTFRAPSLIQKTTQVGAHVGVVIDDENVCGRRRSRLLIRCIDPDTEILAVGATSELLKGSSGNHPNASSTNACSPAREGAVLRGAMIRSVSR